MAFRTVIISTHSKLEYSLGYLVYKTVNESKRIFVSEIHTLIIESTVVSITTSLLAELIKNKINVIFCDENKNPTSQLLSIYGSFETSKRIKNQINWTEEIKNKVWKRIVREKIFGQANFLLKEKLFEEGEQLMFYRSEVMDGDITNREGHAAKVYFNKIFGEGFSRSSGEIINAYLNYGYTILLSAINRIVVSSGYLTQLGIHHCNTFNDFNFSSDLIEPFRTFVDQKAKLVNIENFKMEMIDLLNNEVKINGKNQTLLNALQIYCASVFSSLESNDPKKIIFPDSYDL